MALLAKHLNEKFEGKGWENSISVDSLDELREQLLGLDAILSSGDDDYGFQHFHSNVNVRFQIQIFQLTVSL